MATPPHWTHQHCRGVGGNCAAWESHLHKAEDPPNNPTRTGALRSPSQEKVTTGPCPRHRGPLAQLGPQSYPVEPGGHLVGGGKEGHGSHRGARDHHHCPHGEEPANLVDAICGRDQRCSPSRTCPHCSWGSQSDGGPRDLAGVPAPGMTVDTLPASPACPVPAFHGSRKTPARLVPSVPTVPAPTSAQPSRPARCPAELQGGSWAGSGPPGSPTRPSPISKGKVPEPRTRH